MMDRAVLWRRRTTWRGVSVASSLCAWRPGTTKSSRRASPPRRKVCTTRASPSINEWDVVVVRSEEEAKVKVLRVDGVDEETGVVRASLLVPPKEQEEGDEDWWTVGDEEEFHPRDVEDYEVVEYSYEQRQIRGPSNPHSEHSYEVFRPCLDE
ncbi:hypothetical protein HOP50_04g31470 [Chloropicon primus]|nr:hypothetical protein HOP50_04g31470 [Chloropicon primus]